LFEFGHHFGKGVDFDFDFDFGFGFGVFGLLALEKYLFDKLFNQGSSTFFCSIIEGTIVFCFGFGLWTNLGLDFGFGLGVDF
tara:strand:- start:147 stop:392 length:246 start_codon:yes stop_codon:yes gene_type:complete